MLIPLIVVSTLISASTIYTYNEMPMHTPANTILIFDINQVLLARHGDQPVKTMVLGMESLIHDLHAAGYTLHIASNMKRKKFNFYSTLYTSFFCLFEKAQCVDPDQEPIIKKPNPLFFQQYREYFADPNKPYYIFIDDKQKNISAARNIGIIGIQFKDAAQLRAELATMGILALTALSAGGG